MRLPRLFSGIGFAATTFCCGEALAATPAPALSQWAETRFETISFFLVLLLLFTAAIRGLWNELGKDFPALPRLSYRRTLAGVVLFGLFLAVVLTMVAGARELLTPAAWQRPQPVDQTAPTLEMRQ